MARVGLSGMLPRDAGREPRAAPEPSSRRRVPAGTAPLSGPAGLVGCA